MTRIEPPDTPGTPPFLPDPREGEPEVRRAQRHGLCVMCHSGGTSIPGSSPITADVLLHLRPDDLDVDEGATQQAVSAPGSAPPNARSAPGCPGPPGSAAAR